MQDQKRVSIRVIRVIVSKLHEIWQIERKRHYDPDSHESRQNLREFLH